MVTTSQSSNGKHAGPTVTSANDATSANESVGSGHSPGAPPANPCGPLLAHFAEWQEYLGYYIAAQIDHLNVGLRTALLYAAFGVVAAIAGAAGLVVALVMLLEGLAAGIGAWFDGRIWLGQVIVGAAFLIAVFAGIWFWLLKQLDTLRGRIKEKYELRKRNERAAFGADVSIRAAAQRRSPTGRSQHG